MADYKFSDMSDDLKTETKLAFEFAAEKHAMSLWGVPVEPIAHIVGYRAINQAIQSGTVVERQKHSDEVDKLSRDVNRHRNNWASVTVQADHQLQRVQAALSDIPDRALAQRLADQIGVILPDA